jgi:hypothetical protein
MILDFRLPILDSGKNLMHNTLLKRFLNSCSDHRKSKTCPELCRRIKNLKWLGLSVVSVVLVVAGAQAQQPGKIPRIGYLSGRSGAVSAPGSVSEAFRQGLRDLGYVEGKNILIDNGDRLGRLLGCTDRCCLCGDKNIYLELDEFGHKDWVSFATLRESWTVSHGDKSGSCRDWASR